MDSMVYALPLVINTTLSDETGRDKFYEAYVLAPNGKTSIEVNKGDYEWNARKSIILEMLRTGKTEIDATNRTTFVFKQFSVNYQKAAGQAYDYDASTYDTVLTEPFTDQQLKGLQSAFGSYVVRTHYGLEVVKLSATQLRTLAIDTIKFVDGIITQQELMDSVVKTTGQRRINYATTDTLIKNLVSEVTSRFPNEFRTRDKVLHLTTQ